MGNTKGIPATATAVIMNVTATNSTAPSFLTIWPAGLPKPVASSLNFGVGQTIPNLVTVKLGANGRVSLATAGGTVDVVADVVGYFDSGANGGDLFNGVTPTRIVDTRLNPGGNAQLAAGTDRAAQIRGRAGVPDTATAVVANVTVTNPTTPAFLTVWPSGVTRPGTSNLNFGAGQTIPNLVTVQIGVDGTVSFSVSGGATDVVVDVVGYFDPTAGSRFFPTAPDRRLDDRINVGASGPWNPNTSRTVNMGSATMPVGVTGLVANVTATNPSTGSFVTVYPASDDRPNASNLNFGAGQTIPNLVMVRTNTIGQVALYNQSGTVDLIADVVGYYAP